MGSVRSLGHDINLTFSSHGIPDWLEGTGEERKRRAIGTERGVFYPHTLGRGSQTVSWAPNCRESVYQIQHKLLKKTNPFLLERRAVQLERLSDAGASWPSF